MPDLLAARAQMGTSLAFHIIFSALGVGLPLLLCVAEGLALFRKDKTWMMLARRWARAAAILFAIGAVSGTILSFELGLLWPTYIKFAGAVVGLTICPGRLCFLFRGNFSWPVPLWLGSSITTRALVMLIPDLDQWPGLSMVYCERELLDEYSSRLCDQEWQGRRYKSHPGYAESKHPI